MICLLALTANEVNHLGIVEGPPRRQPHWYTDQVERWTTFEGATRHDTETAVAASFSRRRGFCLGELAGNTYRRRVPSRLKTSNGPVKSSCVVPGKITKPMWKSDATFSANATERCEVDIIACSADIRNGRLPYAGGRFAPPSRTLQQVFARAESGHILYRLPLSVALQDSSFSKRKEPYSFKPDRPTTLAPTTASPLSQSHRCRCEARRFRGRRGQCSIAEASSSCRYRGSTP